MKFANHWLSALATEKPSAPNKGRQGHFTRRLRAIGVDAYQIDPWGPWWYRHPDGVYRKAPPQQSE